MGFDINKNFGTDKVKEKEGVWEVLDEDVGARVLVARFGNPAFSKRWNKIPKFMRDQIQNGSMSDERTDAILCRLIADTLLLSWENLSEKGKELEYSSDEAYRLLKQYPDFRDTVWAISNTVSRYRVESTEGNLSDSSDGGSSTEETLPLPSIVG